MEPCQCLNSFSTQCCIATISHSWKDALSFSGSPVNNVRFAAVDSKRIAQAPQKISEQSTQM